MKNIKKYLNNTFLYSKELLVVLLGQVSLVISSIISLKILTTYLNPTQFGELYLNITITVFLNQLIFGPLTNACVRYYSLSVKRNSFLGYFKSIKEISRNLVLYIIIFGVLTSVLLIYLDYKEWAIMIFITICYAIINGLNNLLNGIQTAARSRIVVAISQGSVVWIRLIFGIIIFVFTYQITSSILLGYLIGSLFVLIIQLLFFSFTYKLENKPSMNYVNSDRTWRKRIYNYALPFTYWGIFTWGLLASDKWALGYFSTIEDVGIYSAVYQLGFAPLLLISGFLDQFISPIIYERVANKKDSNFNYENGFWNIIKLSFVFLFSMIIVSVFLEIFHMSFFSLFVSDAFIKVSYLLPFLWLAGSFFGAGQLMTLYIYAFKNSKVLVKLKISNAVFGILLNISGAYFYGVSGIIIALLTTNIAYFISVIYVSYKVKLGYEINYL